LAFSIDKTPYDVRLELAKKVRILRKQKKYSQEEMAKRSGVSLGSYKRFESSGQIALASFLSIVFVLGRLDELDQLLKANDLEEIEKLIRKLK
jgi:transcriptional regulator with XRE-family HTH domain